MSCHAWVQCPSKGQVKEMTLYLEGTAHLSIFHSSTYFGNPAIASDYIPQVMVKLWWTSVLLSKSSLLHNHCQSFASNTEIMWQKKSRNQAHPGTNNQFSISPHHFINTFIKDHGALQHLAHLRHSGFRITETAAYEITSRLNTEKTSHRKWHWTPLSENVITIETRLEFQINV